MRLSRLRKDALPSGKPCGEVILSKLLGNRVKRFRRVQGSLKAAPTESSRRKTMKGWKPLVMIVSGVILLVPLIVKAEATYQKDIRPIVEAQCLTCHGSASPLVGEFKKNKEAFTKANLGPRMDSYSLLIEFVKGDEAGALMRRLDDGKSTRDKKPGNMYIHLGKNEEERQKNLNRFKDWVGSWNLKRKKESTPEELRKITAPE
jgi:hypothetical protein